MTGRKVWFYKTDQQHKSDFFGSHIGVFHKWGTWDGKTVGLVESSEGTIFMTHPEAIRFIEKYGIKNPDKERVPKSSGNRPRSGHK